tara:strand:+ start:364 stop:987 length:624 start_codon:yes stop_codon:yes gene_type:complete
MAYFDKVSEILYLKYDKNPYNGDFIRIKNIFSRIKIVDDVLPQTTLLEDIFVQNGERPDNISKEYYNDPGFDWVIMMINNINNLYKDWPLESNVLENYINGKYAEPLDIHHYETIEQSYEDDIILKSGLRVEETFQFITPNNITLSKNESRIGISNAEYERRENDKKREILILRPEFLPEFVRITEDQLKFTPSTEFINSRLKVSTN